MTYLKTRIVVRLLTVNLLILLCASVAFSETSSPCGASMTPAEAYQKATAVFAGRVLDVQVRETRLKSGTVIPHHEVRLKVEKSWKLVDREEIVVITRAVYPNTCGSFNVGESYLVYADRMGDTFYVPSASRTNLLASVVEDLDYLGGARVPLRPGEYRTRSIMIYGIIICAILALLIGWYFYRLNKKPLRRERM
jgi:hypothetical protein